MIKSESQWWVALWTTVFILYGTLVFADLDDFEAKPRPVKPTDAVDAPNIDPDLGDRKKESLQPLPTIETKSERKAQPSSDISPVQKKNPTPKHNSKLPIQWTAKGMNGNRIKRFVDLKEDVVVTQGDVRMTAQTAQVLFGKTDEVSKVNAKGDVKVIKSSELPHEKMSARGNEAVFDNELRTVTLIGRAAMWRGSDVVRAEKITYFIDSGDFRVDQTKGVVQPQKQRGVQP